MRGDIIICIMQVIDPDDGVEAMSPASTSQALIHERHRVSSSATDRVSRQAPAGRWLWQAARAFRRLPDLGGTGNAVRGADAPLLASGRHLGQGHERSGEGADPRGGPDPLRDGKGRAGLLHEHCAHRGSSLYYGKVEDEGIRCCYHGWLFAVDGACVEQPCEPGGGQHRDKCRQPWYPVEERYGLVFAYMGPLDAMPRCRTMTSWRNWVRTRSCSRRTRASTSAAARQPRTPWRPTAGCRTSRT